MRNPLLCLVMGVMTVSLLVSILGAQTDRGAITGLITDPAGAPVAGATVTVTNQGTGVRTIVNSSVAGIYTVPVPAGLYQLEVDMSGFKKAIWRDVRTGVLQTIKLDIKLELGTLAERVTVSGEPPLLNAVSSAISTNVAPREYADLPLFVSGGMRGATEFLFLLPGTNRGRGGEFQVNGGQSHSRDLQLDGASVSTQQFQGDTRGFQVPVDAIQEFTVLTSSFSAEFGRTGGGIESFTLKSGTNALHGLAYEFARNDAFDARGFYAKTVPVIKQHEFGANLGGPVRIPKVYNGRDRTFFFVNYTGYRYNTAGTNYLSTVPSMKFREGDFTEYLDPKGAIIPIYDPATMRSDGRGGFVRDPFSGNVIPRARFSKVAKAVESYMPQPNLSGWQNNYISADRNTNKQDNVTAKIDHGLTDRQKLTVSFAVTEWPLSNPAAYTYPISGKRLAEQSGRIARLSHDFIVSPNKINRFTLGFNRFIYASYGESNGVDWPEKIGLKGGLHTLNGFPTFTIGQVGSFGGGGNYSNYDNAWNLMDGFSWQHGRHSIKIGGEIRKLQTNMVNAGGEPGFNFGQVQTALPSPLGTQTTGHGYASFLLGLASGGSVYINPVVIGGRWAQYMTYVQDDWRITSRLTVNLGLRYEVPMPYREVNDIWSNVDLATPNPKAGNLLGALVFMKDYARQTGKHSFYDTSFKEFGPRIGLAYTLPRNLVLRTGYGIYYNQGTGVGNGGSICLGSSACGSTAGYSMYYFLPPPAGGTAYDAYANIDNGFAHDYTPPPFLDPSYANGGTGSAIRRNSGRSPYMQNWNFGFQKQTKGNILLDFGYAGSKGTRLVTGRIAFAAKQLHPKYWPLGALLNQSITSQTVKDAGFAPPFPGFIGSLAQALAPYPQYTRLTISQNDGNSTYHSFQFKAQRRFSNGLSFLISYTASKTIADSFSQYNRIGTDNGLPNMYGRDEYNKRLDKVLSPNDRTHVASISFLWELPFGPGKPLLKRGGIAGLVFGGWQLNGVLQYASGVPLTITAPTPINMVAPRTYTPDSVPGAQQENDYGSKWDPQTSLYLNREAWMQPVGYRLGTSSFVLHNIRSFAQKNENMGLFKTVSLRESLQLQLRWEATNVFNRFIPTEPDTSWSPTSTTFGKTFGQNSTPRFMQIGAKLTF